MKDSSENQLTTLRDKLLSNELTKNLKFSNDFLIKFLRVKDGDVSESFSMLVLYVDMVNKRPEMFTWTDEIRKVINAGVVYNVQEKSPEGATVSIVTPSKWNPSDFSYVTYIKMSVFLMEASCLDEEAQKNGFIVVSDMSGIRWNHIYNTGVSDAKLFTDLTERILPRKLVGIHFANGCRLQDAGLMLFKPFMSPKTKRLMQQHGKDLKSLHSMVPPNLLPASLGGTAPPYDPTATMALIEKHKEELIQMWDKLKI